MKIDILGLLKKLGLIVVMLVVANVVSLFFFGFFSTMGGNVQAIGLNQISFDPLITIAYMILFYFLLMFDQPSKNSQVLLFLLTLFLSFSVNFIQGSVFLIVFFFLLKKLKLI